MSSIDNNIQLLGLRLVVCEIFKEQLLESKPYDPAQPATCVKFHIFSKLLNTDFFFTILPLRARPTGGKKIMSGTLDYTS
jgi:hypothetical protein